MREIKFRRWEEKGEYMDYSPQLGMSGEHSPELNKELIMDHRTRMLKDFVSQPLNKLFSEGTWMQSTGLIDKNGKEIYEGDILKITEHYHEVFWDVDRAMFRTHVYSLTSSTQWDGEIIGNKWENPELLKA